MNFRPSGEYNGSMGRVGLAGAFFICIKRMPATDFSQKNL